jgi:hypothetical protein
MTRMSTFPPFEDPVSTLHHTLLRLAPLILVVTACGSDETAPPADDHTPVSYTVLIDDVAATAPYTFTAGEPVRVRLRFLNAASEDLDDIESTHFAGLTFSPGTLATVTPVSDHHYQFDVTGGAPGSGTMQVGYGHDDLADETTFPAANVVVDPSGGAGPP